MPNAALSPLPMSPLVVEKIWGGCRLAAFPDKMRAYRGDRSRVGESWEVADLPQGASVVAGGPYEGASLSELAEQLGPALIGSRAPGKRFPLLVKLLDASDDLSIQVHPGPDNFQLFEGAQSKDEAWIVIETEPGASLLHGLRPGVTREAFAASLKTQEGPTALLRRVKVSPGDVLHVSPGTQHAICRGVFLLEIQEPSDTTYRVWDYNRPGLDGKLRQLHIEQALAVTDFQQTAPALTERTPLPHAASALNHSLLVNAPGYRIEELSTLHQAAQVELQLNGETPLVLHTTQGGATVAPAKQAQTPVHRLTSVVLPAALGRCTVTVDPHSTVIVAGLGGAPLLRSAA